jgi:AraC-like DNA-binding protein
MHIAKSSLQETGLDLIDTWERPTGRDGMLIKYGNEQAQRLRSLMHATIHRPVTGRWQMERASTLASVLTTIINQNTGAQAQTKRTSVAESWRTIRRAREFVEANLSEPIQINDICAQSATSVSKLERIFRRELQMSPSRYILARRLDAARRELKRANSNGNQIARIATDYGFNHLGRFAGAYRTQFGELPSETLRSR